MSADNDNDDGGVEQEPANPYLAHHQQQPAARRKRRFDGSFKHRTYNPPPAAATEEQAPHKEPAAASTKHAPARQLPYPVDERQLHGNYRSYYGYRHASRSQSDPRLAQLQRAWIAGKDVLDIGCNAGVVTVELAQRLEPRFVLGIDVDQQLVQQAQRHLRHVYSLQPTDHEEQYPQALVDLHGYLRLFHPPRSMAFDQPEDHDPTLAFPQNIDFRHLNILSIDTSRFRKFDAILALSVSKWIHLNHGDNGLKLFFHKCHALLRPGGRFCLEAQGWDSYTKSKIAKHFPNAAELTLRPDDFVDFLVTSVGFRLVHTAAGVEGEPAAQGFDRPLWVFERHASLGAY
ncbi:hypothetical protein RI367_006184 [Sorochytrium milnesiophthora]